MKLWREPKMGKGGKVDDNRGYVGGYAPDELGETEGEQGDDRHSAEIDEWGVSSQVVPPR